jgi:hypothetical protein
MITKEESFCNYIGKGPIENDNGRSLEVWMAAWDACAVETLRRVQLCNLYNRHDNQTLEDQIPPQKGTQES